MNPCTVLPSEGNLPCSAEDTVEDEVLPDDWMGECESAGVQRVLADKVEWTAGTGAELLTRGDVDEALGDVFDDDNEVDAEGVADAVDASKVGGNIPRSEWFAFARHLLATHSLHSRQDCNGIRWGEDDGGRPERR